MTTYTDDEIKQFFDENFEQGYINNQGERNEVVTFKPKQGSQSLLGQPADFTKAFNDRYVFQRFGTGDGHGGWVPRYDFTQRLQAGSQLAEVEEELALLEQELDQTGGIAPSLPSAAPVSIDSGDKRFINTRNPNLPMGQFFVAEQGAGVTPQAEYLSQRQPETANPLSTYGFGGAEVLDNPLLKAISEDVGRRVFANQAARGKLGSGSTLEALQDRLAPTAIGLRQQQIDNLMNLFTLGSNVAAGQGSAGISGASGIGSALQAGAAGQSQALLNAGQAQQQGLRDVAGFAGYGISNYLNRPTNQVAPTFNTGELYNGGGSRPYYGDSFAAGPLQSGGTY
jgi:hypothetical protein